MDGFGEVSGTVYDSASGCDPRDAQRAGFSFRHFVQLCS